MVRRLLHAVDIFEVAEVAFTGKVAAERADRLAVLDGDEGVAEGVERIGNRPGFMVGERRVSAEFNAIDLVAEPHRRGEHRFVPAEEDVDGALIRNDAFEAGDREVEARPFLCRLGEIVEETGRERRLFPLDPVE